MPLISDERGAIDCSQQLRANPNPAVDLLEVSLHDGLNSERSPRLQGILIHAAKPADPGQRLYPQRLDATKLVNHCFGESELQPLIRFCGNKRTEGQDRDRT